MSEIFVAEAPSNIALIKYMGKISGVDKNRPTNPSLSFTLPHLRTRVEVAELNGQYDEWQALQSEGWIPTQLSERGRKRYLAHFAFLKQKLGVAGHHLVRSANNFPSDCGIASSASSFAALTLATYQLAQKLNPKLDYSQTQLAELSRLGSGSSIRSFLAPLVLWNHTGVSAINLSLGKLKHQVVVVEQGKKAIGSSDAHERVTSSLLFRGRPERAEERLNNLLSALQGHQWQKAFEIMWAEFWDMHALFMTSSPPFHYINSDTMLVLDTVYSHWQKRGDGPLVTLDAGANVHLIYREDQSEHQIHLSDIFNSKFSMISGELNT